MTAIERWAFLTAYRRAFKNFTTILKMNGVDWNAVLAKARVKIAQSNSMNEALTQIAIAVSALNDSHTVFEPPARPYRLDFGVDYQLVWNRCFVMHVRPGSDAEAQGLKRGAEILAINGLTPARQNYFSIDYLTYTLDPKPEMHLEVRYRSGEKQDLRIKGKVTLSPDLAYRPGGGRAVRHLPPQRERDPPHADGLLRLRRCGEF